jgi:hypothetical protein
MAKLFHPLLALIASATDRELSKYVRYLKEENRILSARLPKEIHTRPSERVRLLKFGKPIGRASSPPAQRIPTVNGLSSKLTTSST